LTARRRMCAMVGGALSETVATVSLRTKRMLSMFRLRNKNCSETGPNRRCSGPEQYQKLFRFDLYWLGTPHQLPKVVCVHHYKWRHCDPGSGLGIQCTRVLTFLVTEEQLTAAAAEHGHRVTQIEHVRHHYTIASAHCAQRVSLPSAELELMILVSPLPRIFGGEPSASVRGS